MNYSTSLIYPTQDWKALTPKTFFGGFCEGSTIGEGTLEFLCLESIRLIENVHWTTIVLTIMTIFVIHHFIWPIFFAKLERTKRLGEENKKLDGGRFFNHHAASRVDGKLPPVYPNGWYKLLDSHLLKKRDSRYISALGQNFAVFRGEDGIVRIVDAYCPHLGANLGIGGKVKGDCIECPFHGWQFDGEGACQSIPYSKEIPKGMKTKAWKCTEMNGMILVFFDAEGREPDWTPSTVEEMKKGKLFYHGRTENHIGVHVQEILENAADLAHLNTVHSPVSNNIFSNWMSRCVTNIYEVEWDVPDQTETTVEITVKTSIQLFGRYNIPFVVVRALQNGPGLVIIRLQTPLGEVFVFQAVTPLEPLHQQIDHTAYAGPFVPRWYAKMLLGMIEEQLCRDIVIWNEKTFLANPKLTKEETKFARYRRWYTHFYSKNSPTVESIKNQSLDW